MYGKRKSNNEPVKTLVMEFKDNWERLIYTYRKTGIALALGAGVSAGCKLPEWKTLLERIAKVCLKEKGTAVVNEMNNEGFTLPAIAGVLEACCPENRDFGEVIRDALYQEFKYYKVEFSDLIMQEFVNFIKTHNNTISSVAALCVIKDASSEFITNPLVHAIANTNFDAILRVYSQARHNSYILRTIDRPSAVSKPGKINIYHLHGFFHFKKKNIGKANKEAPDIRVFTEHEFFDFFNQPNSLYSYTFLFLLREHTVIFIGMSLQDDNIRRLLHYSRKEIYESYLKENKSKRYAAEKAIRHFSIQKHKTSPHLDTFVETSFLSLGVRILWINDYDEIPFKLKELYESTGNSWDQVY